MLNMFGFVNYIYRIFFFLVSKKWVLVFNFVLYVVEVFFKILSIFIDKVNVVRKIS